MYAAARRLLFPAAPFAAEGLWSTRATCSTARFSPARSFSCAASSALATSPTMAVPVGGSGLWSGLGSCACNLATSSAFLPAVGSPASARSARSCATLSCARLACAGAFSAFTADAKWTSRRLTSSSFLPVVLSPSAASLARSSATVILAAACVSGPSGAQWLLNTLVGLAAASALVRAVARTEPSCRGWQPSQAYTVREAMSQLLTWLPHSPQRAWL
mmetsp:Transcript_31881/g.79832  ORF Transcript_31881/g.79832 Transcript_31881/m.79832 type:complete len:218 (-) Transcript_31881:73-726(-)